MLQFEEFYFQGETRDGFYIEPMMKRCWAAQMEVLADVDAVCKKHNIMYFIDWGTLLGAVRHHGFIPWDDDVDISMKREDYEKFSEAAVKDLPEHYSFYNVYTDTSFIQAHSRVVNTTAIKVEEDFLKRYHGFPYVAGVDIFPLDYCPTDSGEEETLKLLAQIIYGAYGLVDGDAAEEEKEKVLATVEDMCRVALDRKQGKAGLKNQLIRLLDKLFQTYRSGETTEVALMIEYLIKGKYGKMPKECFDEVVYLPFEQMKLPAPIGYDMVLKHEYGEDYMIPRRGGAAHDYPYYKKQRETLRKWLEEHNIPEGRIAT